MPFSLIRSIVSGIKVWVKSYTTSEKGFSLAHIYSLSLKVGRTKITLVRFARGDFVALERNAPPLLLVNLRTLAHTTPDSATRYNDPNIVLLDFP